jgi:hypothetical protein
MTETQMAKLEGKYRFIESIHFKDVVYAVDNGGKGIHVLYGRGRKKEMIIGADDVDNLLTEIKEVWEHVR